MIDTLMEPIQANSCWKWKYGLGCTPPRILIATWNINGIRSIMRNKMIFSYLREADPHILCAVETRIDQKQYKKDPIFLQGYEGYWNFPKLCKGYSGVAIFSKTRPISMSEDFQNSPQYNHEGRLITMEFEAFIIILVYVPMSGMQLQRLKYRTQKWDVAFREHCKVILSKGKPLLVCGDFNVAHTELDCHPGKNIHIRPSYTRQERDSFGRLLQCGFIDIYRKANPKKRIYTWWNKEIDGRNRVPGLGIGKRLDYYLIDKKSYKIVQSCNIRTEVQGSDHCPIEIVLNTDQNNSVGLNYDQ